VNKMPRMSWSFYQIWNESLEQRESRKPYKRKNLWASELGKAPIDLFLKMNGVAPSNPFDPRTLRKFEAGNIWEWIVGLVLKRAGVFKGEQGWVSYQYPGLLEVTGKLDFLAGGKPDWEESRKRIEELELPPFLIKASNDIINHFKNNYPEGLNTIVLEVKSCSAFMFERYLKSRQASSNHRVQSFHYIKAKDMKEAHIVYISKDDARMLELGITNPSYVENEYKALIEEMTHYIEANERPPLEKVTVFDEEFGRFSVNWRVKYSGYLKMLYGFENQSVVDEIFGKQVAKWNRVLNRCVEGKKMTKLNLEVIGDVKREFKDFDELVEKERERRKILVKSENENDTIPVKASTAKSKARITKSKKSKSSGGDKDA